MLGGKGYFSAKERSDAIAQNGTTLDRIHGNDDRYPDHDKPAIYR
jgi:hypothetical protein